MKISEAKKNETRNLKEAIRRFPRLFETKVFIDNQKFLERYGISIPKKKKLPPKTFPLLNFDKKTWFAYKDLLNKTGIFSLNFILKNLKPFPFVLRKSGMGVRDATKKIKILNQKIIPEGVILNFNLPKTRGVKITKVYNPGGLEAPEEGTILPCSLFSRPGPKPIIKLVRTWGKMESAAFAAQQALHSPPR